MSEHADKKTRSAGAASGAEGPPRPKDAPSVTLERRGHVVLIGLNRPHKRNAFTFEMLHALAAAYTEFEEDPDLWCAVLHAHGEHFTGGLDLADVAPHIVAHEPLIPEGQVDFVSLIGRRRTKPVVAGVQGWCLTIGIELLLAADIRIAADNTRFAQIEVQRGILPFGGATIRFPQVAGWGNAMRYLLTGDAFGPEDALRMGLIQEIVPTDRVLERSVELAERVAAQAPLAVQATLASARAAVEEGPAAATAMLHEQLHRLMATQDAQEGLASFLERRAARFQGK